MRWRRRMLRRQRRSRAARDALVREVVERVVTEAAAAARNRQAEFVCWMATRGVAVVWS